LPISKEGDVYLCKLLVQGVTLHYGEVPSDTDSKRWGTKLAGRSGTSARKRASVACRENWASCHITYG
jgi:hypothetical protein